MHGDIDIHNSQMKQKRTNKIKEKAFTKKAITPGDERVQMVFLSARKKTNENVLFEKVTK